MLLRWSRAVFCLGLVFITQNSKAAECDPAISLADDERQHLVDRLVKSPTGKKLLDDFEVIYGSLQNLTIQWDRVSFSQVVAKPTRVPAAIDLKKLGEEVCIHLALKLPEMEHIADFAHELVHVTRLPKEVYQGNFKKTEDFIKARIALKGGEAEAFAVECTVKYELLGEWDGLCAPYVLDSKHDLEHSMDLKHIVKDLYNGSLAASLTGEPYPIMLERQFKALLLRRTISYKNGS